MNLTDDMKKVISYRILNGTALMYLGLSAFLLWNGFLRKDTWMGVVSLLFGLIMFFICEVRVFFVDDVKHNNVEIINTVVIDKYVLSTGHKRSFIVLQMENGETKQLHVIPREYQNTTIGDSGLFIKNKLVSHYFPMSELLSYHKK